MILVTGAAGFVGAALCQALHARGKHVVGVVRNDAGVRQANVGTIGADTDWGSMLIGCQEVIHLAARVHVMADTTSDPLGAYREANVDATLNLARQAAKAGVKRFVFVSSIKVNGESTAGRPFRATDLPLPNDPYGQSKLEAERGLQELARETGMEVVIVRPPLVYGPGVKANFKRLLQLVQRGVPLPFGRIVNRRSMVAIDNLVDFLIVCTEHPNAAGGVFLVSDGLDLSTADLVRMIARAMGKNVLLVPVPATFITFAATIVGKAAAAQRLLGSLQVDITQTKDALNWKPVVTPQAAIDQTVAHFFKSAPGK
jgi:nucleoside-diphosphate-sugar epimerase